MTADERLKELLGRMVVVDETLSRFEGQSQALEANLNRLQDSIAQCRTLDVSYQKLQGFFQSIGSVEQERLQRWFEQVITYGMQSVFGNYRFVVIGPEIRGSDLVVDFKLMEAVGTEELERDPYTEMGGGVADVLSFLLQFLMVFLLRDRIEPILFIDEGFKHLSKSYEPKMAALLRELVDRTPVQIVLVTHKPEYVEAGDVVYHFDKPGKETIVERLK